MLAAIFGPLSAIRRHKIAPNRGFNQSGTAQIMTSTGSLGLHRF